MKSLFVFLFLIPLIFGAETPEWTLEVKDELMSNNPIVFKAGVYTKVTFVLKNKKGEGFDKSTEEDINFKITLDDENLVSVDDEYTINPSNSLEYSAFIGLKIGHKITDSKFKFKLKIKSSSNKGNLFLLDAEAKISLEKVKLDIKPIMEKISAGTYNLFKIMSEPFNIDPIEIKPIDIKNTGEFEFPSFIIEAYGKRKFEYSPENPANNGILFDSQFGTKIDFEKLKNAKIEFELKLEEKLAACFEFIKQKFSLEVIKEKLLELNDKIKQAIAFNTENISPKFDSTNGLTIRTVIPLAPVVITCELRADSEFSKDEDIINQASADANVKYYKNVITSAGQATLHLGNLNATAEYFAKCVFSTTEFGEKIKAIALKIGNFIESDVMSQLLPSRDPNRVPQCAEFEFDKVSSFFAFELLATKYCRYVMLKDQPLIIRILGGIICQKPDSKFSFSKLSDKTSTICVAPSPAYNFNKLIPKNTEEKENFNDKFDSFVNDVSDGVKILKNLGLDGLKVNAVRRYYDDEAPNPQLISVNLNSLTKEKLLVILPKDTYEAEFSIVSDNKQPIECYYDNASPSLFDKLINITLKNGIGTNVRLNPGEEAKITVGGLSLDEGSIYTLHMNCYNLPGFRFRYESTGIFPAYSFIYNKNMKINTKRKKYVPVKINCEEKINKINPHCIRTKIITIAQKLKTEIPEFIRNLEGKVDQFVQLANEAQMEILNKLNNTLKEAVKVAKEKKEKLKDLVESAIETARYLANKDCSIYASGEASAEEQTIKAGLYIECRNNKTYIISQIINALKDNLDPKNIVNFINDLTDDIDQNLKYILFTINEIVSNPEALEKEVSEFLYKVVTALQEKFEEYWVKAEQYLKEKKGYIEYSILAVKRDISNIIMQILSNLVNVLHFDEIDGHIQDAKEAIKETGLIVHEKALQVHKNIFDFVKRLNEFGEGFYNISASMALNVSINAGLDASQDSVEFVSDFKDKGILLLLHNNYMLRDKGAYAMQSLIFDSPLISIEANREADENTVNTFIDVTLYDKDGNEIFVGDLSVEAYRPTILYKKSIFKNLKKCLFYNVKSQALDESGIAIDEDYTYNGEKYVKCVPNHLTSFTAGTSSDKGGIKWWAILLIVLGILIVLAALVIGVIYLRKMTSSKATNSEISGGIVPSD